MTKREQSHKIRLAARSDVRETRDTGLRLLCSIMDAEGHVPEDFGLGTEDYDSTAERLGFGRDEAEEAARRYFTPWVKPGTTFYDFFGGEGKF